MKLQNWVLELWSNYEIATGRFFNLPPPCTLSTGDAVRRRRPPGRTGAEPQAQTTSCAPGLPKTAPSWHHLGSPRAPAICALATATAGRAATAVRASPGRPFPLLVWTPPKPSSPLTGAVHPVERRWNPPEHRRRRAAPPPSLLRRGTASSVHLPASQDHH